MDSEIGAVQFSQKYDTVTKTTWYVGFVKALFHGILDLLGPFVVYGRRETILFSWRLLHPCSKSEQQLAE